MRNQLVVPAALPRAFRDFAPGSGHEPGSTLRLALLITTIAMYLAYALTVAALVVGCRRAG